ncbi:MAG: hypothetical protein WBI63_03830 [Coriobacteriia bacterium]
MNKKVLVGVLIGVLVLAAAGVGYGAYSVAKKGNEQDRRAEVIAQSRVVDDKLEAVWDRLSARDSAWRAAADGSGTSMTNVLELTTTDIAGIKELIGEAKTSAMDIPSDEISSAYVAVCDELATALDECAAGAEKAAPICEAYDLIIAARDDDKTGFGYVNQAIDACNDKKWSEGKSKAQAGVKSYKALKTKLVNANKAYEAQTIQDGFAFADAGIKYAEMQYDLAVLGSKGSINGYNTQIGKIEKQNDKLNDLAVELDDAEYYVFDAAETAYGGYVERAGTAEAKWRKVKKLVTEGTF